jgi:hypothetical protein
MGSEYLDLLQDEMITLLGSLMDDGSEGNW